MCRKVMLEGAPNASDRWRSESRCVRHRQWLAAGGASRAHHGRGSQGAPALAGTTSVALNVMEAGGVAVLTGVTMK